MIICDNVDDVKFQLEQTASIRPTVRDNLLRFQEKKKNKRSLELQNKIEIIYFIPRIKCGASLNGIHDTDSSNQRV